MALEWPAVGSRGAASDEGVWLAAPPLEAPFGRGWRPAVRGLHGGGRLPTLPAHGSAHPARRGQRATGRAAHRYRYEPGQPAFFSKRHANGSPYGGPDCRSGRAGDRSSAANPRSATAATGAGWLPSDEPCWELLPGRSVLLERTARDEWRGRQWPGDPLPSRQRRSVALGTGVTIDAEILDGYLAGRRLPDGRLLAVQRGLVNTRLLVNLSFGGYDEHY